MVKKERDHETQIRRIRSVLRFVYVSKLSFLLWQTQALANEIRTVCCVFSTKIYNRLVKLQNYVRRSESKQALDLGGVFSLRFMSREPASERTSFYLLQIFWFYFRFHAEFENCFLAKMRLKVSRSSFLFEWFIWFICPGTVDIIAFHCNFSWAW